MVHLRRALLVPVVSSMTGCFLIYEPPLWTPDAAPEGPPDAAEVPIDAMDARFVDAPWPDPPRVLATFTGWTPGVQTLTPANYVEGDWFGSEVALSSEGRRVAIAAPNDRTATDGVHLGSVRVFEDDGTGTFIWRQFIRPQNVQHFGMAVAIEGDVLAITDDGNGNMTLARVHIYRRDASGVWQPEWILATPPSAPMVGDELHFDRGRLMVSMRNFIQTYESAGNGTWPPLFGTTGTLEPPSVPRDPSGIYASSFAIDGDRLVVGDTGLRWPHDISGASGGAVVYERSANQWTLAAVLPPVFAESSGLGTKVAISGDDIAVAAGATNRVEMWHRGSDGTWTPTAHLSVSGPGGSTLAFGTSLVLTPDLLLVGSGATSQPPPSDPGHAFRFVRSGTTWAADGDLIIPTSHAGDNLGIAMAAAANRIAVGANLDDSACPTSGGVENPCDAGAVHVITLP